jgi:hypothetical protein
MIPYSGIELMIGGKNVYTEEEVLRDLNAFKIDTLQRVLRLEVKVDELVNDDTDMINDIQDLREVIIHDVDILNQKIDMVRDNTPSTKSVQVMISVTAVIISAMAIIFSFAR